MLMNHPFLSYVPSVRYNFKNITLPVPKFIYNSASDSTE